MIKKIVILLEQSNISSCISWNTVSRCMTNVLNVKFIKI